MQEAWDKVAPTSKKAEGTGRKRQSQDNDNESDDNDEDYINVTELVEIAVSPGHFIR